MVSFGEDGAPQGLFEMAEIAYVGAGVLASAVAMDKVLCKDVLRAHDLPVTPYLLFYPPAGHRYAGNDDSGAEDFASYPLFTKPVNLGSSVGINKCHNRAARAPMACAKPPFTTAELWSSRAFPTRWKLKSA